MSAQWLLNWWNLIFLLPFALALLYMGLYTASGVTFGDADADGDVDADVDADAGVDGDVDHDVDADTDADADHDLDADQDLDGDHDAGSHEGGSHESAGAARDTGASVHLAVLSWLGMGRVPLSIVVMVLLLTWGVAGFLTNAALQEMGERAALFSIPIAALAGATITHVVASLIGRYLPLYETTARRRHSLLGSVGEAMFPIDERFGMVSVRDGTGDLYQVPCRIDANCKPVAKGAKVQLVSYNAKQGLFYVAPRDAEKPVSAA